MKGRRVRSNKRNEEGKMKGKRKGKPTKEDTKQMWKARRWREFRGGNKYKRRLHDK